MPRPGAGGGRGKSRDGVARTARTLSPSDAAET